MSIGEMLPEGVRDFLGEEARRHRVLEQKLARVFQQWGFSEVITPCFEFYEQLEAGLGSRILEKAYKFFDNRGRILALRPEMTTPIARVAATSLGEDNGPIRLYYMANIFRIQENGDGRLHEFYQAGGEILGVPRVQADAEVIALAIQCLERLGISDFKVGIGQIAFLKSLLASTDLTPSQEQAIIGCLQERNLVGLEQTLRNSDLSPEERNFLWELLTKNGNGNSKSILKNLLNRVNPAAREELAQLEELFETLAAYKVEDRVYLDLGIVRNLDYYTGVIFEVYGPGLGRPLGGGGRYDGLPARFGRPLPATGFALGFPELLTLCHRQGLDPAPPVRDFLIVPEPGCYPRALELAQKLRAKGNTVEVELRQVARSKSLEYARQKGFTQIVFLSRQGEEITHLQSKNNPGKGKAFLPFCGIH